MPSWQNQHPLSIADVADLLAAQFSELVGAQVRMLREGWESTAYVVNEQLLFRFPKRADVVPMLERELRLLPVLRQELPLAIPDFRFNGEPTERYPLRFVGYPLIQGTQAVDVDFRSVRSASIARQLGAFLRALHTFDRARAEALLIQANCGWRGYPRLKQRVLAGLSVIEQHGRATAQLRRFFDDESVFAGAARAALCLVHNDLSSQHIILDAPHDTVVGIIDFGDADVGDAAGDFGGLFHWGGRELCEQVLEHYALEVDAEFLARARWTAACLAVFNLQFGLANDRPEEIEAGQRAMEHVFAAGL